MAASLFEHEAIRTTEAKGKDLRRFVEKLITAAKKGTLHARRRVIAELQDRPAYARDGEPLDQTIVQKLFNDIAPRYADRPGGYTRITRLPDHRIGDAGRQVLIQLVEETASTPADDADSGSRRRKRAAKRIAAADAGKDAAVAVEEEPAAQDEDETQDEQGGQDDQDK